MNLAVEDANLVYKRFKIGGRKKWKSWKRTGADIPKFLRAEATNKKKEDKMKKVIFPQDQWKPHPEVMYHGRLLIAGECSKCNLCGSITVIWFPELQIVSNYGGSKLHVGEYNSIPICLIKSNQFSQTCKACSIKVRDWWQRVRGLSK